MSNTEFYTREKLIDEMAQLLYDADVTKGELDLEEVVVIHPGKCGSIIDLRRTTEQVAWPYYLWVAPHPAVGWWIEDHWEAIRERFLDLINENT